MPAHIYVRVGQYQKAIDNNVRSQQVDKQFAEYWGDASFPNIGTYPLSHKIHAPHAIDFIRYAATVQGNYETAIDAALASAATVTTEARDMRNGQKRVAAPWLTYKIFGKWDALLEGEPEEKRHAVPRRRVGVSPLGSAYAATGEIANAEAELQKVRAAASDPKVDEKRVGASATSEILKLASYALDGEIKQAKGDLDGAIESFAAAAELEDNNNYTEPPDWAAAGAPLSWRRPAGTLGVRRRQRPYTNVICAGTRTMAGRCSASTRVSTCRAKRLRRLSFMRNTSKPGKTPT